MPRGKLSVNIPEGEWRQTILPGLEDLAEGGRDVIATPIAIRVVPAPKRVYNHKRGQWEGGAAEPPTNP